MTECIEQTLGQTLKEEGELLTVASGISMLPCIREKKDLLHLAYSEEPPALYDVILYRRKNGTQILHRILDIQNSKYVLCGDNQYMLEMEIEAEQVMGVLRGFYRGSYYVNCRTNRGYQLYVKIWCSSLQLRKKLIWLMSLGRKGWNRVTWKKKQ